ncbi:iron hydrogenase small subunit [Clostridium botulinum]|nr:iron hydrogenase small subunit [Clostridium botulinum]
MCRWWWSTLYLWRYKYIEKRTEALYKEDSNKEIRKSHENPYIKKLYEEYLGKPYGEKAHELLHTKYRVR